MRGGGGALLIPGAEYADAEDRVHVPTSGPVPFLGEAMPTSQLLEAAARTMALP